MRVAFGTQAVRTEAVTSSTPLPAPGGLLVIAATAATLAESAGVLAAVEGAEWQRLRLRDRAFVADVPRFVADAAVTGATRWGVDGRVMSVEVARYGPGDRLVWHSDGGEWKGGYTIAGLSFAVMCQLSDPADYTGGALEARTDDETFTIPRARGTVALLRPNVYHRVRIVSAGCRFSLIALVGS
jgi:hypothetical protein